MMPSEEKRFVRSQNCFLLRNMMGQIPQPAPPRKSSGTQPLKMLLPFKTDNKIPADGKLGLFLLFLHALMSSVNIFLSCEDLR